MKRILLIVSILMISISASGMILISGKPINAAPCTTMGASGIYKFWGNNDYSGDTDQACTDSGSGTIQGTTGSGETIDTWSNFGIAGPTSGGTYGVKFDANDEFISYTITAGDIINTSEGTIALDIYLIASTGNNSFASAYKDANNYIKAMVNSDGYVYMEHKGNSVTVATTGADAISDTTWTEIRISWSVTSNQISVKVGANDWDTDLDEDTVTALSAAATDLYVGDGLSGTAIADGIYIDNYRVSETYQDGSL